LIDSYFYSIQFSDCPFEEHAVFHPLCDYIIYKRGLSYIERIIKESIRSIYFFCFIYQLIEIYKLYFLAPHARQKCEMNGTQIIKSIFFGKPGMKSQFNFFFRIHI
jgi:hypothetical protein